jgi:hypothetical protein
MSVEESYITEVSNPSEEGNNCKEHLSRLPSSKKRRKDRPSSRPKKGGRPKKSLKEAGNRTLKRRVIEFTEKVKTFMGDQTVEQLNDVLAGHFLLSGEKLIELVKLGVEKKKISESNLADLIQDVNLQPDLELLLFLKDLHSISDHKLWIICKAANRPFGIGKLVTLRQTMNIEAQTYFKVVQESENQTIQCSCERAIKSLLEIAKKNGETLPKELQVKVCADGRAWKKGQFVISITPLNLKTFSVQSRDSVFQILLAQVKETANVARKLSEKPYLELEELVKTGIVFDKTTIGVKVFFIPGILTLLLFLLCGLEGVFSCGKPERQMFLSFLRHGLE